MSPPPHLGSVIGYYVSNYSYSSFFYKFLLILVRLIGDSNELGILAGILYLKLKVGYLGLDPLTTIIRGDSGVNKIGP